MVSICGALATLFFLYSIISGLLAAGSNSALWAKSFWVSLLFFLAASGALLFLLVPLWIALAPAIPALILVMIFRYAKPHESDSDEDADG